MPCGGIDFYSDIPTGECIACLKPGAMHYVEEWDAMIHARCALAWLTQTPEGQTILKHGHEVHLHFSYELPPESEEKKDDGGQNPSKEQST